MTKERKEECLKEQAEDIRSVFKRKISACFEQYKEQWMQLNKAELIERAEEIDTVTRMAENLPGQVSDKEAEYLLRFKNPLEVVSDIWISRNGRDAMIVDDEMSHILWGLLDTGDAELVYEMEPEYGNGESEGFCQSM